MNKIDKLIINSPYKEPEKYWSYKRETREFLKEEGRRPAGYVIAFESYLGWMNKVFRVFGFYLTEKRCLELNTLFYNNLLLN